jgi:hypothetical protein
MRKMTISEEKYDSAKEKLAELREEFEKKKKIVEGWEMALRQKGK